MNQIINALSSLSPEQLRQLCEKYHIQKLSLFGSALREDFTPDSDIDLLVEFEADHLPSLFELVEIQDKLSTYFGGREVDLRTYQDLSRYFRDEILAMAETIYDQ